MNLKNSTFTKILATYIVVSLIVPVNLLFAIKANAQIKEPVQNNSSPQISNAESEPEAPVFSVTPNDPPDNDNDGNNDNPPPKEIKIDGGNN